MKLLILILVIMLFCIGVSAQKVTSQKASAGNSKPVVASGKDVGRYEVIAFPGIVIKLDTFTGRTYGSDKDIWMRSSVGGKGLPDESLSSKSKYRVYAAGVERGSSTISPYVFYLLNTETGQTWFCTDAFRGLIQWREMIGG
jgi:hypothetical protein